MNKLKTMENKTVAELEAMTAEEISALTPQQKATRTKIINANKPATPQSGDLAAAAINAAAGQKTGTTGNGPVNEQEAKDAQAKKDEAAKLKAEQDANDEKEAAELKAKKEQEAKDAEAKELAEQKARLDAEQLEADAEEAAAAKEADLLAKYGPGYIYAKRGDAGTYFSAIAWDLLGKNKDGWVPDVKVPDEVANFQTKRR